MTDKKFIGVIGSGECTEEEARLAEDAGHEIARRGAFLVCGGLGGVMAAACKGAVAEGGTTIGILPGDSRETANPHVRIPIVTDLGEARNVILVKSCHAIIAIGGGYGTLSEIGHALRNNLTVIGLKTWSLSRNGEPDSSIIPASTAHEAVSIAFDLIS